MTTGDLMAMTGVQILIGAVLGVAIMWFVIRYWHKRFPE